MVGQRYLALDRGTGPATPALAEGAEIPLDRTTPALDLTDLFNGFKPLFQALSPNDVNQLSGEIVRVLQGEGGTVESLLAHTGSLTTTLAGRDSSRRWLPAKCDGTGRTATYGSWLTFSLPPPTLHTAPPQGVLAPATRCGR